MLINQANRRIDGVCAAKFCPSEVEPCQSAEPPAAGNRPVGGHGGLDGVACQSAEPAAGGNRQVGGQGGLDGVACHSRHPAAANVSSPRLTSTPAAAVGVSRASQRWRNDLPVAEGRVEAL